MCRLDQTLDDKWSHGACSDKSRALGHDLFVVAWPQDIEIQEDFRLTGNVATRDSKKRRSESTTSVSWEVGAGELGAHQA